MANIPTPRSYNQILGEMIAAFLARYPIENLKVGGPILSMLEAGAQSDLRNTSDIFKFLASTNLDSAEGDALTKILKDEGTNWLGSVKATGYVTIGDSRYTKKASAVYFGKPAPIIGSTAIYVSDAAGWPATGNVYIGRNTSNYEGPLAYISIVNSGSYYTINLAPASATTRFHNLGESVILAQGGNRTVSVGSLCGTSDSSVQYSVKYAQTLLDGEVELEGVQVVCTQAGTIGNAPVGAINTWVASPFSGATVTNSLPFTNGFDAESTEQARARVRKLRKARAKGTDNAIEAYLAGVTSIEDNKRITSVKVVSREGLPTTAFIDDGTGYEETTEGVAYEVLTSSAVGGEQYFQLQLGRPVAKAFIQTSLSEPFAVVDGSTLTVRVGGVVSEVTFQDSMFRSPGNAEAYEVVHAINAEPSALFSARLSSNGTKVTIFAKDDTNEDIEVTSVPGLSDANGSLGFPLGLVETVALYKNDILLSKDGRAATIEGNDKASWLAMVTGDTITVNVDGTGDVTYTVNDVDFVNAGTGYLSVASTNSLQAWAAVLNYKIPGITVSVVANRLEMSSNLGADVRGSLEITGGTLVVANMFPVASASAKARDYTLNRNTGQLRLVDPLVANDTLTVGTDTTTAFLESDSIGGLFVVPPAMTGNLYFVVDGSPTYITLPLIASTTVTFAVQAIGGGAPVHGKITSNQNIFADVLVGDWLILTDSVLNALNAGQFRVAHKVSNSEVWVCNPAAFAEGPLTLLQNGVVAVRTTAPVQKVSISAGSYTAESLALLMNTLEGAHGAVVRTGRFRVVADTRDGGNIMLVANDLYSQGIPLEKGVLASAEVSHNAYVEAGNPENDIPIFLPLESATNGSPNQIDLGPGTPNQYPNLITGLRSLVYNGTQEGFGNAFNYVSAIKGQLAANSWELRDQLPVVGFSLKGRAYSSRPYCIGPLDDLSVVLDGDIALKRYEVRMSRKLDLSGSAYNAAGMTIADGDSSVPFGSSFGSSFSFNDWALYMHPRVITDSGLAEESMWRWKEMGAGGEKAVLRFDAPTAPDQSVSYSVLYGLAQANPTVLSITLPSGAARTLTQINPTTRIGRRYSGASGSLSKVKFYVALFIRTYNIDAAGEVTLTLTAPEDSANTAFGHGIPNGATLYVNYNGLQPPVLVDGPITVTGTGAAPGPQVNQIKYQIGGPQVPGTATGSYGYLYYDVAGPQDGWNGVLVGDILVAPIWGSTVLNGPLYVSTDYVANWWALIECLAPATGLGTTDTLVWSGPVGTDVQAFPLQQATHAAVNALDGIPATVTGAGGWTPQTAVPTWVTALTPSPTTYVFKDGINYVKTTTAVAAPADYTIDLKNAVDVGLAGNSYWPTEEAYLVPITSDSIRDFLNVDAVSGLGQSADVRSTTIGEKVQIVTDTVGRAGRVEVLGGLANEASASIMGNSTLTGDSLGQYVLIPTSSLPGFQANWPCELVNTLGEQKPATYSFNANLVSIVAPTQTFTFGADLGDYTTKANINWQIEKQGRFMAMVWNGLGTDPLDASVEVGDYLVVQNDGGTDTVSPGNCGTFIILGYNATARVYWIENANGVEERVKATVVRADRDSVMPGDILSVGTDAWGIDNKRAFTIATVDYTTKRSFTTAETPTASGAVAAVQALITLRAGSTFKAIKTITAISPYSDPDYSVLVFGEDATKVSRLSSVNGTEVIALSKLAFPSGISEGKDGYDYNTGLIGEANRVLYGLETDPVTYPGVVASGANVNISGPVVRKVEISLALRLRNGANKQATFDAVRSAIATFINSLDIGTPVAISQVITVAEQVGGVEAVSVASPTYGTTSDLIAVQPYEKPMVLQPDLDITLTLIS